MNVRFPPLPPYARRVLTRKPKTPAARAEAAYLLAVGLIFVAGLIPAIAFARREYRDGVRRERLREVKHELEAYFNDHGGFPAHPSGDLGWCGSTEDREDWFFRDLLRNTPRGALPRDPRHVFGHFFRYCPTALFPPSLGNQSLAEAFFLEVRLENVREDSAGFNEEYRIWERTLSKNGRTFYRICGGAERQCAENAPPANNECGR